MFLVELVMQGVGRFKDLSRLRFQSGFNFIAADNEAGKTTAADVMLRLLFPKDDHGLFASLVSRTAPEASRGALVVHAGDGSYYRVIQDFSKRGVNLSLYNASTKEFSLLHKDWRSAAQFMADMTSGISEQEYERIFLFRREHYDTGHAAPLQPNSGAQPVTGGAPPRQSAAAPAGRSPEKQARLDELREALRKAEEAADADYRAQSAKVRLQEIARKIEGQHELDDRAAELEGKLAELKGCDTLPDDLIGLIEEHERNQVQKMSDVDRISEDIAGLQSQMEIIPRPNILLDPLFIGGVFIGGGSVAAALFVLTTEQAVFFPVGMLAAMGLLAGAWYRSSRKNAERKVIKREIADLEAEREEIERGMETGGAQILSCMEATGAATTGELKDLAESYRYYRSLLDDAREQRERTSGAEPRESLHDEYDRQQQEVIALERAVQETAEHHVDTYSLRQEIERLEQETAASSPAAQTRDFSAGQDEAPFEFGAPLQEPAGAAAAGGFFSELDLASRVAGIEMETLVPAVEAAAQRNLLTVTGGAYVRLDIAPGRDPFIYDKEHVQLGVNDLSHSTAEAVYFCLRAGLVEALAGKLRFPFVLDDPLARFDTARQKAGCNVLRTLGAKTQVILLTSNPALRAQGDAAVELK